MFGASDTARAMAMFNALDYQSLGRVDWPGGTLPHGSAAAAAALELQLSVISTRFD